MFMANLWRKSTTIDIIYHTYQMDHKVKALQNIMLAECGAAISLKVDIQLPELNYFRVTSEIDTKTQNKYA